MDGWTEIFRQIPATYLYLSRITEVTTLRILAQPPERLVTPSYPPTRVDRVSTLQAGSVCNSSLSVLSVSTLLGSHPWETDAERA